MLPNAASLQGLRAEMRHLLRPLLALRRPGTGTGRRRQALLQMRSLRASAAGTPCLVRYFCITTFQRGYKLSKYVLDGVWLQSVLCSSLF